MRIPLMVLCILMSLNSYADENTAVYSKHVSVIKSSINYFRHGERYSISTVGILKNTSDITLKDIVIEVRYFNSNNEIIDSEIKRQYSMLLPPGEEVSFSVKGAANGEKAEYVSHAINILSAEKKYGHRTDSKEIKSALTKIFISWLPMLILIFVWLYVSRSKKYPHARSLELLSKNNKLLIEHNKYFERLVTAIENKPFFKD